MTWSTACSTHRRKMNAYRVLMGKLEGNRPLGRPIHRLEDNIKTDFTEIGRCSMDWIHLAQDTDQWRALENTIISFQVP
jgi:hypothetical protein